MREGAGTLLALCSALAGAWEARAAGLSISNLYSPWNRKRPRRPQTRFIVLHTTEGEEKGSLNKIRRLGEAHYFVTLSGHVYRIIDRTKIATHAGRSMWQGLSPVDNYSLGIEVVGKHNEDITAAQYGALAELLRQLKSIYKIPDSDILTHSMVAYGRPNRFHRSNHRGRKRCGMIFSNSNVRQKLGLMDKPEGDSDVERGRLKVGDPDLYAYLFAKPVRPAAAVVAEGSADAAPAIAAPVESNVIDEEWTAWRIARELYNAPETTYVFPDGTRQRGDEIKDWGKLPKGTQVLGAEVDGEGGFEGFLEIGKDGNSAQELAGEAFDAATSIYFFPDGFIRTGEELKRRQSTRALLEKPPAGTRVLVGYVYGGHIKTQRLPSSIAGIKWNYPSTYYRFPGGRIVSGDEVNDATIPAGTLVFYQR